MEGSPGAQGAYLAVVKAVQRAFAHVGPFLSRGCWAPNHRNFRTSIANHEASNLTWSSQSTSLNMEARAFQIPGSRNDQDRALGMIGGSEKLGWSSASHRSSKRECRQLWQYILANDHTDRLI